MDADENPAGRGPKRFSLIVATVGRVVETKRLFESLVAQTCKDFEVIVVDQNEDDRLDALVGEFESRLTLYHLRSQKGVSRARNAGLAHAIGDIVAFPDDDCWYFPDTLAQVEKFLAERPDVDGVCGRTLFVSPSGSRQRFRLHGEWVSPHRVWSQVVAIAMFFRRKVVISVGEFDVSLGPGSGTPWGSADESEYAMRAVQYGHRIWYTPMIRIQHPGMAKEPGAYEEMRERAYARGMGRTLRIRGRPVIEVAYFLSKTSVGWIVAWLLRQRWQVKRRKQIVLGIWEGWTGRLLPEKRK